MIPPPVEKDEKSTARQFPWEHLLYGKAEPFKAFAHVHGDLAEEDAGIRSQGQHGHSLKAARQLLKVFSSKPWLKWMCRPLYSMETSVV